MHPNHDSGDFNANLTEGNTQAGLLLSHVADSPCADDTGRNIHHSEDPVEYFLKPPQTNEGDNNGGQTSGT